MVFKKLSLDDREIMRKYRVQINNFYVSSNVEEFTSDHGCIMKSNYHTDVEFGIQKKAYLVSHRHWVSRYVGNVNGGS